MISNREFWKLGTVFAVVYFVQGMSGLPSLPIQYLMKNVMKLDPSQAQYFASATMLAWLVKPLWGYISDTFPIFGYRRKPYLIGMSLFAAFSWFGLAWMAYERNFNYWGLLIMFNLSAAAYAFVDVVCDGLMVTKGQATKLVDAFVNIQWFGIGIAGIFTGLVSGFFAETANKNMDFYPYIFAGAGIIPILTAVIVILCVTEERVSIGFARKKFLFSVVLLAVVAAAGMHVIPYFLALGGSNKILFITGIFLFVSLIIWLWSGKPKLFWMITAFVFFWKFSPSVGMASFYYFSEVLKFPERFFGYLDSIGSVSWVAGIILYGWLLKKYPGISRKTYLYFSVLLSAFGLFLGYLYYLDPRTMIFGLSLNFSAIAVISAVFFSLLGAPSFLLPLAIAGDAAKSGKEAITYAWFMSVSNFAGTMSSFTGGWLYENLQNTDLSSLAVFIGTGDFLGAEANKALLLRLFVWISALFTLFTIPLILFTNIPERKESGEYGREKGS